MLHYFAELSLLGAAVQLEQLKELAPFSLFRYADCRFIRPFTAKELLKLRRALPSERILQFAIDNMDESRIHHKCKIKSAITLFCEDFPHLESLYYCEKHRKLDDFFESLSKMTTIPFVDYNDMFLIRLKCKALGKRHPWWNIADREVRSISGVPIETAKGTFLEQRKVFRTAKGFPELFAHEIHISLETTACILNVIPFGYDSRPP